MNLYAVVEHLKSRTFFALLENNDLLATDIPCVWIGGESFGRLPVNAEFIDVQSRETSYTEFNESYIINVLERIEKESAGGFVIQNTDRDEHWTFADGDWQCEMMPND